jgi:hypothetical protein
MKKMIYIAIISCLVSCSCIYYLFFQASKYRDKVEAFQLEIQNRRIKVETMRKELSLMFWDKKNQVSKYYIGGVLDTLDHETGVKTDQQFLGWVLAKRQVNKAKKAEGRE